MIHIIEHTIVDSCKLLPFLFLAYLIMEYLEDRTGEQMERVVKKAGRFGPLIGGVAGIVPQCGFAAAASNLYAGKIITAGTLIAIYMSTSDEMLPILISSKMEGSAIAKILLVKVAFAIAAGFLVDILWKKPRDYKENSIHQLCEKEHCNCENGIFRSALVHTLKIFLFVVLITFLLNLILHNGGEEILENVLVNKPLIGPVLAGIIGLIPNCVSSVVLTRLFVAGTMGFGTMMAGLMVNAGVGVLVLCRVNKEKKDTACIIGILYLLSVVCGVILQLLQI